MEAIAHFADGGVGGDADIVPRYVTVVVQADGPFGAEPLTYAMPEGLTLSVGDAVLVPFGAARDEIGYVVAIDVACDPDIALKVKEIRSRLDGASAFDESLWTCARWVCEQTLSEPRDVIRLIAPSLQSAHIKTTVQLLPEWESAIVGVRSAEQKTIIERLANRADNTIELSELSRGIESAQSSLAALRKRNAVSFTRSIEPSLVRTKRVRTISLSVAVELAEAELDRLLSRHAEKQADLLARLVSIGTHPITDSLLITSADSVAAKALVDKGLAEFGEKTVRRDPFGPTTAVSTIPPLLTEEQAAAAVAIASAMETDARKPFLLYGVTGSGKTEVYLDSIERTRQMGKGALFLLPEIGLTAQVMDLLRGRFGSSVAVLHSALSDGERHDEWQRILRGEATIVVGARSAVFAPVKNLGLIIVDEEHETSFKQDNVPRYHARDVARFRARQSKAVLVLGSATPSIESYYYATHGIYTLLTLSKRVAERPLPPVIVLDQRLAKQIQSNDDRPSNLALNILSEELQSAIAKRLGANQQSILFINRRGFSTFLLCRDCGFTFKCPNCDVTLTYHRTAHLLQCHHCGHRVAAPIMCPKCTGYKLWPFGLGTEKVEEAVKSCFPNARTLRMDRDTTERKGSHADLLRSFRNFESDILIGTQMVAKGLDFPNVTLVGVISADTALNIPDYRASERAFQLLTQVAGRAGRGESEGEVYIQTFDPEQESIRFAKTHDYVGFYNHEIGGRELLHYPPFGFLANIVSSDVSEREASGRIERVSLLVRQAIVSTNQSALFETLGPVVCPLSRIKNKHRLHVVVRCRKRRALLLLLKEVFHLLPTADRMGLSLDIDPMTML